MRPPRRYELLDLALERELVPDSVLRAGSIYGAWARERRESRGGVQAQEERMRSLVRRMSTGPIAEVPEKANEQHYELPAEWLEDGGKAFVHVFSHRTLPYLFEDTWASARFFTAGVMPSHDLLPRFQEHLRIADSWIVPGTHYARTLEAWLERLDSQPGRARLLLRAAGRTEREARRLLATWRLFVISTREIWGYRGGNRWLVSHYLLEPQAS